MPDRPTVLTVIGARPQFIKAAPVSTALRPHADQFLVNTGQHYDDAMARDFVDELGIPEPDVDLEIGSGPHGDQTGRMLAAIESVVMDTRPDVVQVFGDTNSTLAGALAAAKLGIPVAHVEAGLRSWRRDMPEEINRVLTDHVSSLLLCPTPTAAENLEREGIVTGVHVVGDVMVDAVHNAVPHLSKDRVAALGVTGDYLAATMHRPVNVDEAVQLARALDLLASMPLPVAIAVHPRTAAALERHRLRWPSNVQPLPPLGYLDMLSLARYATAVLTDSGGLQKEAILVGARCIVLRDETEWVETVTSGLSRLVGLDATAAREALDEMQPPDADTVEAIFPSGASQRVVEHLLDLAAGPTESGSVE